MTPSAFGLASNLQQHLRLNAVTRCQSGVVDGGSRKASQPLPVTSLEASYLARAECGAVVCTSRGCRPILPPEKKPSNESQLGNGPRRWAFTEAEADSDSELEWQGVASERMETPLHLDMWEPQAERELALRHLYTAPVECVESPSRFTAIPGSNEDSKSGTPDSDMSTCSRLLGLAEYAWKIRRNMARAEFLFERALKQDPENATALASYASFLWEYEASMEALQRS